MLTYLVTGGAGFIGANLIHALLEQRSDVHVVNLDALTYAANLRHLAILESNPRYTFVCADIRDAAAVQAIFTTYNIDAVLHLAAESHVDRSIQQPLNFVETNVLGTAVLLEAAKNAWLDKPQHVRADKKHCRFLHISTDEVFGSLGATGYFTEASPYAPNSPYSASKAASDMLVRSYYYTYGLPAVITNCSNNYGRFQHAEKLIPTIIRKALAGESIPIYGDGGYVRDWLHVADHVAALLTLLRQGRAGEQYVIGGHNEYDNLTLAGMICTYLDQHAPRTDGLKYASQITHVADRPGHDRRYAIDAAKIRQETGWVPNSRFEDGLSATIDWYLQQKTIN